MRKPALLLVFALFLTSVSFAQQHAAAPATQHSETQGGKQHQAAKPAEAQGPSQELAKASHEAAGEEEENAQFKESPSVKFLARITGLSLKSAYWLAIGINFLVIAAAIAWVVKSKLPGVFRARTQDIRQTLEEARKSSEDANRRLSEIEGRLAKLDSEIANLRATAEADAATEEGRIRAAAEEDARKVVEGAESEIEATARLARRELKAYAAELAVTLAEKRIHVDAATDHALVQSFTRELGANNDREGK
jgi:F-type H+-transporting ATPase subunit b